MLEWIMGNSPLTWMLIASGLWALALLAAVMASHAEWTKPTWLEILWGWVAKVAFIPAVISTTYVIAYMNGVR